MANISKEQKLRNAQEMNKLLRDAIAGEVIPNSKRLLVQLKRRPIDWVREYLRERMMMIMEPVKYESKTGVKLAPEAYENAHATLTDGSGNVIAGYDPAKDEAAFGGAAGGGKTTTFTAQNLRDSGLSEEEIAKVLSSAGLIPDFKQHHVHLSDDEGREWVPM